MSDRELLELAAKAAGIEKDLVGYISEKGLPMNWNPLTDDGDALRLAAALGIAFTPFKSDVAAQRSGFPIVTESVGGEPLAAARRAIVRAAAEIGRSMP